MDRRAALKSLAAAPFALALPRLARADAAPQRLLVMVFLYGGNDGYNTWVPYTDALYPKVRPTIAVPRDAVLKVTDHHGFHPSLAPLMPSWQAGDLAMLQGIGYPEVTQQHYRDEEIAFTGDDTQVRGEGWVSRALAKAGAPTVVALDMLDVRESDPMGPFRGEMLPVVHVHYPNDLLVLHRVSACAIETNRRGVQAPTRIPAITGTLRTAFPTDPFGKALRAAAELAAVDRTLPVIHVTLNGLDEDKHHSVDCHWKQLEFHGDALQRLAAGLAAFRAAMQEIGRWDETLVATYDEFGRSPVENEDRGTHHGASTTHFLMGGRVKGGAIGKPTPVERVFAVGGPAPTMDTRELWTMIAQRWWNVDARGVFNRDYKALDLLRA